MPEITRYPHGTFCWAELSTTDAESAKKFYTQLFGWTYVDSPINENTVYTMFQWQGKNLCALYQMDEQKQSQGIPPHWLSYVSVEEADSIAGKVKSLGGRLLTEPFDVFDIGRMAVIQDPQGAVFAIWQPKKVIGAQLTGEPPASCWNELATTDTESAAQFYTVLFGWDQKIQQFDDQPYTLFLTGDQPAAGMYQLNDENMEIPPHWLIYFAVENCDSRVIQAQKLGGEIIVEPADIPTVGRFAVLKDPQGAIFAIIKLEEKS